ncbi:helix-turn-helix transcriptional regulator [Brevibacterium sp. CFH 10365]|uniref:helix-turn-helix transcriptional regulator n=1 Tax=Brevibacterium sp. CFH 10365 TaxID=2585207 RepID=UPI00187A15AE|nr:helix-turn-helix domain-containing protein [Brevibacterium sp. CFH 10365]
MMGSLLSDYPPLLLRSEVAEILRVSVSTLSRWARDGLGPECLYLSEGSPRYTKGSVIDYLTGL